MTETYWIDPHHGRNGASLDAHQEIIRFRVFGPDHIYRHFEIRDATLAGAKDQLRAQIELGFHPADSYLSLPYR